MALGVPEVNWDKKVLIQYERVKRFHDLMWNMHKVYKKKTTKHFIKKQIEFIYRSEFERRIYKQLDELQVKIFSKCGITGELESGSGQKTPQVIDVTTTQKKDYCTTCTLK